MPEHLQHTPQGSGCVMSIVTILAVYQILFASRVLIHNRVMAESQTFVPAIQIGIAVLWAGLFAHAVTRLWQKQEKAIRYSLVLMICFILSSLLQTVLFVQADYNRNRISFLVMVTLMILIVPVLLLLRQSRTGTHK